MRKSSIGLAILFLSAVASVSALRAADAALRVEGVAGGDGAARPALALSMADLAAMPRSHESMRGHDGKDHVYEGVLLTEILKRAGQPMGEDMRGKLLAAYLLAWARDGYRVVFALPEFDPAFTAARALVADRLDGNPLFEQEGPLRLVVPTDKRQARSVRMLQKLEIVIVR